MRCVNSVDPAGTAAEITPVIEVDGRRIGAGRPGPPTRRLQKAYFACAHGEWLTMAG